MELAHVDLTGLSAAQRDVLAQALESYAIKCERRSRSARALPVRREAGWRGYVARELLELVAGE